MNIYNGGDMMISQHEILQILSDNLPVWKDKHGVQRIGLFGSYSREEQKSTSDIDIVVGFLDGEMTFDNFMDLKFELEDCLKKPVDLVILDDIKPAIQPSILKSIKYAEGA